MKAILALSSLAALGFALAGCASSNASGRRAGTITLAAPTTTTIANVKSGDLISCAGVAGAAVPPIGQGVAANADGPSASGMLQLTRQRDGSVVAVCRASPSYDPAG